MNNTIIFDISALLAQNTGSNSDYSFDGPVDLKDIDENSHISGTLTIMKIDEGVNVYGKDIELDVNFACERCLKKFSLTIEIPELERQFLIEEPKNPDDINDIYLINKKKQTIDLSELLRQEIILHFPSTLVCSKHCKGICQVCGADKNVKDCDCKIVRHEAEIKPLAILKELIK